MTSLFTKILLLSTSKYFLNGSWLIKLLIHLIVIPQDFAAWLREMNFLSSFRLIYFLSKYDSSNYLSHYLVELYINIWHTFCYKIQSKNPLFIFDTHQKQSNLSSFEFTMYIIIQIAYAFLTFSLWISIFKGWLVRDEDGTSKEKRWGNISEGDF